MQLLFLFNKADELSEWHTHVAIIEQGTLVAQGEKAVVMDNPAVTALLDFDPATLPDWPVDLPRREPGDPLVRLSRGSVRYGETVIFSEVGLVVNQGDHTLLTGANGSGKSTLLSLITGDHPQCYGNDLTVLGYRRGSGESIWDVKKQIGIVSPGLHRDHRVPGSALHIAPSGFSTASACTIRPRRNRSPTAVVAGPGWHG